jgi:hypothetical protein
MADMPQAGRQREGVFERRAGAGIGGRIVKLDVGTRRQELQAILNASFRSHGAKRGGVFAAGVDAFQVAGR